MEVDETATERKRRLARERKQRWLSHQSQDTLQRIQSEEAEAKRSRRQNESAESSQQRREADAETHRIARANESLTLRSVRQNQDTIRHRKARTNETMELRSVRQNQDAIQHREARANETMELRSARQNQDAIQHRETRTNESPELSSVRQNRDAVQHREARENESPELSSGRQNRNTIQHREAREIELPESRLVRQNLNTVQHRNARAGTVQYRARCGSAVAQLNIHDCGAMDNKCQICGALHFKFEKTNNGRGHYSKCCHVGKVPSPTCTAFPEYLKYLFSSEDEMAKSFRENIRSYNSALSFASVGAKLASPPGRGPFVFRIHGQIYHRTSHMLPEDGKPAFAQLYFFDSHEATKRRMDEPPNINCSTEIMGELDKLLRSINPFANAYKMLKDYEEEVKIKDGLQTAATVRMVISDTKPTPGNHAGRYNAPTSSDIAVVFQSTDGLPPSNRDICIYPKGNSKIRISTLNNKCDPMSYVLLFPHGELGWSTDRTYTQLQHYSYQMSVREQFSPIHRGGRLFQQYIVDSWVKIEGSRLDYNRRNQKDLRVDSYMGLMDHVNRTADAANVKAGIPVILPSTFIGSPRAMQQNFQDAMCMVREFGKPDLFVTFTCNPKWNEIQTNLLPGQRSEDRPDLVSRVFDLKKDALLHEIIKEGIFGKVISYIYVIEFQKRGLPHMHLLLTLSEADKIRDTDTIDSIVCAELPDPDEDPDLFNTIKSSMIHGPCGTINPNSPCMEGGKCTKQYPKLFQETTVDSESGYPVYRRRDNGRTVQIRNFAIDNRWIVPYNPYLSKRYGAHINVEVCSTIQAVKYLFKYVYKGHDCANIELKPDESGTLVWDEISTYVDARYVSAPEAIWRTFEKQMHDKSHTIIRLPIHLESLEPIYFRDGQERAALEKESQKMSQLKAWFELNRTDEYARGILYPDIPKHYTWNKENRIWKRRVQIERGMRVISRLYTVSPRETEKYHLRMLLFHVPGATSFADLRSVDNVVHDTYKEACRARNLLADDAEWHKCLEEAISYQMPASLRQLFVFICVFNYPSDPLMLWDKFKNDFSEDYQRQHSRDAALNLALCDIEDLLLEHDMTLKSIHLPPAHRVVPNIAATDDIDVAKERRENEELVAMLTEQQKEVYDQILAAVADPSSSVKAFSLSAPGGCGKSFVSRALISAVRSRGDIVKCVAWTGMAACLLPGGRTAHGTFKLPLKLTESTTCKITQSSVDGRQLVAAKLIIWDECTMTPHLALSAIDRLLRDLTGINIPFGGKTVFLCGDWRQSLPIAFHSNRTKIVQSCLKNSELWSHFKQFQLERNLRTDPDEKEFADWLLKLGNGTLTNADGLHPELIEVPPECVITSRTNGEGTKLLIDAVFGENFASYNPYNFADKAILCPKNDESFKVNDEVLDRVPGETVEYISADSALVDDKSSVTNDNFPTEFVNSLTPTGLPRHRLRLKIGAIVMLLRNLSPSKGLCNGTRLVVRQFNRNIIECEILTGNFQGDRVFLPRIKLAPTDTNLPFTLQRIQFPIRLSYCMTITKSQGQTLTFLGIYLLQPVFTHGQLYVAFSRGQTRKTVFVLVENGVTQGKLLQNSDKVFTKNVVFKEIFSM